jgi:hypothetical protein
LRKENLKNWDYSTLLTGEKSSVMINMNELKTVIKERLLAVSVHSELVSDPERISRLNSVQVECSSRTGSWQTSFKHDLERIANDLGQGGVDAFFKDKDVLDIGCGKEGGFAIYSLSKGARSYLGVDIDEEYISSSAQEITDERAKFVCDDPIAILSRFPGKFLTISSGVMVDHCILLSQKYRGDLIWAIAQATLQGELAIHQTNVYFHKLFMGAGMQTVGEARVYVPEINTFKTRVYQRR